jgi:hypothetical protein
MLPISWLPAAVTQMDEQGQQSPPCAETMVILAFQAGVAAGSGGVHGLPVTADRKTVRTSWPCLRAVSM